MERYDYYEAVKADVHDWIIENVDMGEYDDPDVLAEYLNEVLWCADGVTGNASGSYTFSTWQAEEYLCHNWPLLSEALDEFGRDGNPLDMGAETCDVIIRCYLLGRAIADVVGEMYE